MRLRYEGPGGDFGGGPDDLLEMHGVSLPKGKAVEVGVKLTRAQLDDLARRNVVEVGKDRPAEPKAESKPKTTKKASSKAKA